jgi:hypothetical protein
MAGACAVSEQTSSLTAEDIGPTDVCCHDTNTGFGGVIANDGLVGRSGSE